MNKEQIAKELRRLADEGYGCRIGAVDDDESLARDESQFLEKLLKRVAKDLVED